MSAVKSGLMIIDQHRADIRIRYERYLNQLNQHAARTQRLLFPEITQFSPAENVAIQKIIPELQNIGFELSDLGGGSYAISGMPAELEGLHPVTLLQDLVNDAVAGIEETDQIRSTLALSLARNAATPKGQVLNNDEMEKMINELFACSNVNYTPDGKTILCIMPQNDIERLLG